MLFGHGWVDKTRPHNLLADWSQEKKQHVYREIEMDEKKNDSTHGNRYMYV